MANSYTQTGQIKQVNGENSGTWGTYENTNFDINALLVGGQSSVSLSGTDVTVTNADGVADQGKNRVFLCTGILSASINLIFPLKAREYIIVNNCTGAFTLTAKPASGTGVVIPQTTTGTGGLMIYCDGTNMVQSVALKALGGISLSVANVYTAQQNFGTQTLTYGGTIAWNLATQQVASIAMAGNATLSNPSNMVDGGTYILKVTQDATGSRILSYAANYNFGASGAPVLTITPSLSDYLTFISDGTKMNFVGIARGF